MKKWMRCSLLLTLGASMLLVCLISLLCRNGVYRSYNKDWPKTPAVAGMMQGAKQGIYPWTKPSAGQVGRLEGVAAINDEGQNAITGGLQVIEERDKTYEFTTVTQDYFDDAVFIGDSRTVGLRDYSGWSNPTYYASIGLTVYDMFTNPIVEEDGQKITVEEALNRHQFGKIYFMIGINEMGTGTVDSFMEAYEKAVAHLRELQPDAIIYVQGIMYVTQSRSERDPIFNNPAIRERNERIAALANNRDIFYIDVNEVVADENGNLNDDYTWDETHLLGKYYSFWTEFLLVHGIVKE
ncbi:MAG: acylhydrolase [Lachnospiraceae bacterium]|nr:acylhydrolase [Lachnospiraceae bacterium]